MAISAWYNGWSPEIRTKRGNKFYSLLRRKALPPAHKCELCASTRGLSFHAEEYGSTWGDYLKSTHALCCYCHATMHVRHRFPNRWSRFVARTLDGQFPDFPYSSMSQVYGAYRGVKDIPEAWEIPESDHWVAQLSPGVYEGPPKVALVEEKGILLPDPFCYGTGLSELVGVRFDAATNTYYDFNWSAP